MVSSLNNPLAIVIILSVLSGLGMILLFGYTSDQKAIGIAKDQIEANLLAVRLYRDQVHVVISSYGKLLRGTARYLRLAFKPLLYVIIPITLLITQLDRCLGLRAIQPATPFLVTAHISNADALNEMSIELPPEITATAPPVHIAGENEVVWRLIASREGDYEVKVAAGSGETAVKTVKVSSRLTWVSPIRLRDSFWRRIFLSGERSLPASGGVESIRVDYPERSVPLGIDDYEMNWIWLFFILSMIAGFIFKELLGIKI